MSNYCAAHAKGLAPSKCSGVFLLALAGLHPTASAYLGGVEEQG